MYHSITFGTKNTWDDWHLIPLSRPVFNPPEQKRTLVEVPGRNGALDFSTVLTGYPTFQNRTGSIEFIVDWNFKPWIEIYGEVMNYLQGQTMDAVLEDEPDWKYTGTFNVKEWESKNDGTGSRITIEYNVAPYKQLVTDISDANYPWDPFDLINGVSWYEATQNIVLPERNNINYNTAYYIDLGDLYLKPFKPTISFSKTPTDGRFRMWYHQRSGGASAYTLVYDRAINGNITDNNILFDRKYDMILISCNDSVAESHVKAATFSLNFKPERM